MLICARTPAKISLPLKCASSLAAGEVNPMVLSFHLITDNRGSRRTTAGSNVSYISANQYMKTDFTFFLKYMVEGLC